MNKRTLIATDFDNTLINDNSDIRIKSLVPNSNLPEEIHILRKLKHGWTRYMREIFCFLHKEGIRPKDYYECLSTIPLMNGLKEMLTTAYETRNCDIIVLSDANTVFIQHILDINGIQNVVKEIFTNPASFNEDGCLMIQEYQDQDVCNICTRNMCKGLIILDYLKRATIMGNPYERVAYIGDGSNDVCPALKLGINDLIFARKGYSMAKCLKKLAENDGIKPAAAVFEWKTGFEIHSILFSS